MRWLLLLCLLFAIYLGLAAVVPPFDDELYYWCWSNELQWSYYDHPPLMAYMIRVSTSLFGHSLVAIRIPACLCMTATFAVLLAITRPRHVLVGVLLTPLFSLGAVLMTPDPPLLACWSLYLLWLIRCQERLERGSICPVWFWALGGVILGLGILAKYTAGLLVPAGGLSFLLLGGRRWWGGYVLHGLVAACTTFPLFLFNLQHNFEPLLFQWRHTTELTDGGIGSLGEFLAIQVLLVGTLPVVLFPWVLLLWRHWRLDPCGRACVCLYALPFLFFLYKSLQGLLQPNWPLACYLGFWPLAAVWFAERANSWAWLWAGRLAFALPLTATVILAIHMISPWPWIKPNDDRVTRQYDRMKLAAEIAAWWKEQGNQVPVFTTSYQWTALLRFHGIDAYQEPDVTRISHFTRSGDRIARHDRVYYLAEFDLPDGHTEGHRRIPVKAFPLLVRGEHYDTYQLWEYRR